MLHVPFQPERNLFSTPNRVWFYDKADFVLANRLLSSIPWDSVLPHLHTEAAWLIFKELFLRVMHKTIPSELVFSPSMS